MKSKHSVALIFFFVYLFIAPICIAQPKIYTSAKPDWLREITKSPVVPDFDEISLGYYFEKFDYQINLKEQTRYVQNIKVLIDNSGAENAGQINIDFDPQYQKLYIHEVKIIRGNETIDQLNLANFKVIASETERSRFLYNGTYSAYLILDDLRKDDKIILSYSLKGFNPVFAGKFFDSFYLQYYEPVGLMHVSYVVPQSQTLNIRSHAGAADPIKLVKNGYSYYSWEETNLPGYDYEEYEPAWYETHQWIECSEYKDWKEVGLWAKSVNEIPSIEANSPLRKYADEIWSESSKNVTRYAKLATDFVQNDIRYMGVELGEYSHRANNPNKVFNQRYGDCKDKSVLLVTLLRDKGIDASLVLAHTTKGHDLDNRLPSAGAFNHMVVQLTINGHRQFIDPTISNQSGEFKSRFFPYYEKMLVLNSPDVLVDAPLNSDGFANIVETFALQKDGSATLEVYTLYTGFRADNLRSYFASNAKKQIQKDYLDYYSESYKSIVEEKPLRFVDNRGDNSIEVYEYYTIEDFVNVEDGTNKKYLAFYASSISEKFPEIKPDRKAPIAMGYPSKMSYSVILANPDRISIDLDPEFHNFHSDAYSFVKNINFDLDTMRIHYDIEIREPFVKQTDLKEYYSNFKDRDKFLYTSFYLNENGSIGGNQFATGSANAWAVLYAIAVVIGMVFFYIRYNKTKPSSIIPLTDGPAYASLRGWLIVLAIAIALTIIRLTVELFTTGFFSNSLWDAYLYLEDTSKASYWAVLIFELTGNVILIVSFVYCMYLLLNRRDLFPATFLYLTIFLFLFLVLDIAFGRIFLPILPFDPTAIGGFAFPIIWGLYVYNSERVKDTFVVPYYPVEENKGFEAHAAEESPNYSDSGQAGESSGIEKE
ncbi:DUF3857 domain-containing protein [Sphingobacterium hungaricum]